MLPQELRCEVKSEMDLDRKEVVDMVTITWENKETKQTKIQIQRQTRRCLVTIKRQKG